MAENIVLTNKYIVMRTIKFRVWDGEKMISESRQDEYDDYYMLNLQGEFFGHTRTGDEWFDYNKDETNKKPFVLMQFTGLKDSRDIDIYEGDIIKKTYGASIPVFAVAWHDARAMFIQHDGYNEALFHLAPANMKVIGNIYENPDLLKV